MAAVAARMGPLTGAVAVGLGAAAPEGVAGLTRAAEGLLQRPAASVHVVVGCLLQYADAASLFASPATFSCAVGHLSHLCNHTGTQGVAASSAEMHDQGARLEQ